MIRRALARLVTGPSRVMMGEHGNGTGTIHIAVDSAQPSSGIASLAFNLDEGVLDITSTFVPETGRGKGLAAQLCDEAFVLAKQKGVKVRPTCPYVKTFLKSRPELVHMVEMT